MPTYTRLYATAVDLGSSGAPAVTVASWILGPVTVAGTNPPQAPALSGIPTPGGILDGAHAVVLAVATPGPLGVAQVTMSLDGGLPGAPVLVPASGIVALGGGVTATFAAGTYGGDNTFAFSTSAAVNAELAAVSSEADTYLRKVATLPLVAGSWDLVLTQKVCHIAAFNLYSAQGFNPDAPGDQALAQREKTARAWFALLAAGDVTLGFTDSSIQPQQPEGGILLASDPPRGWGRGYL